MMKRFGRRIVSLLLVTLILISAFTLSTAAGADQDNKSRLTFRLINVTRESNAKLVFSSTINGYSATDCIDSGSGIRALTDEDEDENGYKPMEGYVSTSFIGTGDVIFGSTLETGMTIQNTSSTADIICNYIMEDGVFNYSSSYVVDNATFSANCLDQSGNVNSNNLDVETLSLCRIDQSAATIVIPKSSTVVLSFTTPKSKYKSMTFSVMNFKAVKTSGEYTIGVYFGDEVDGVLTATNLADGMTADFTYDVYDEFAATYADGMTFSYDNSADTSYTCIGLTDDDNNFYGIDSVFYPTCTTTLYPVLLNDEMPLYQVENKAFTDFQYALDEASYTLSKRVILIKSGILEAGDYTIPSDVSVLIPFDDAHTMYTDQPGTVENAKVSKRTLYRKLTLQDGVNITVEDGAAISVSAKHPSTTTNKGTTYNGAVAGGYGQIHMEEGSTITLNGSSNLYAWGFVTGDGFIEANEGSTVYEYFQINDFRGGTITSTMASPATMNQFPLNQYYVQNIEAHLRINYGASEKVLLELYAGGRSIGFICSFIDMGESDECMFRLKSEGSYLEKYYNYNLDKSEYIVNGYADIDAITLSLSGVTISSADYYLPITNIDVTLLSGSSLTTDKKIVFLPGSSVTVEEGAEIIVTSGEYTYVDENGIDQTKTCVGSVIFAAKDDIGKYSANGGTATYPCKPVIFTPTSHATRTWANTPEVFLDNNGSITVEGDASLAATSEKAQIYSSTGDGTFTMNGSNATSVQLTCYQSGQGESVVSNDVAIVPALIQDEVGDGDPSDAHSTSDTWGIPATFKKVNGVWGDFRNVTWLNNEGGIVQTCENLAYDAFLAMQQPDPEVKPDDEYGSYTFLGWIIDTVTENTVTVIQEYKLIRPDCTLTWMVDDTVYATTTVPYREAATFDGVDQPSKAANAQYKFTFVGWTIDGETVYTYADELPVITDDTTFRAVFSTDDVIYTVWFRLYDIKATSGTRDILGIQKKVKYGTTFDNLYTELYADADGKPNLVQRLKEYKKYSDNFSFVGWGAAKNQQQARNNARDYKDLIQPDQTIVIDGTYTYFCAAFVYTTGEFTNHSISLNDNIGVNYYMTLPDGEDVNDYTIGYTFRGEYNDPVALAGYLDTAYTDGVRYKFTVDADAPQMTDGVTAILYKSGKPVDSDYYRVVDYSTAILEKSDDDVVDQTHTAGQVKPLVRSMLNYGAWAQAFFAEQSYAEKVNADSAENYIDDQTQVDYDEVTDAELEAAAEAGSTDLGENTTAALNLSRFGLAYHGVSAVLDSRTALRLYFRITDVEKYEAIKDSITFGFADKAAQPQYATENQKFIYIEFKGTDEDEPGLSEADRLGITISKLGKAVTMKINGETLIKYSVMDYLKKALDNEKTMITPNEKLLALITAMYHYNQLAVGFFS